MFTVRAIGSEGVTGSGRVCFCDFFRKLSMMPISHGFNAHMKAKSISAAGRESARAIAAGPATACGRTAGCALPMFADMPRDLETRLLSPARQLGMDRAWMHGRDNPGPLADPSGAMSVRNAFPANETQLCSGAETRLRAFSLRVPGKRVRTGWAIRRAKAEGFLPADRERGAV